MQGSRCLLSFWVAPSEPHAAAISHIQSFGCLPARFLSTTRLLHVRPRPRALGPSLKTLHIADGSNLILSTPPDYYVLSHRAPSSSSSRSSIPHNIRHSPDSSPHSALLHTTLVPIRSSQRCDLHEPRRSAACGGSTRCAWSPRWPISSACESGGEFCTVS